MSFLPCIRIWIVVSVLASAAGWILSALGQLNGLGYTIFAGLALAGFIPARRELMAGGKAFSWSRIRARFSRPLPLAFAGLAGLVFLGGALYAPSNYDALTYRLPRVMHWLTQGQWHWIHTANYRMNDRSCGFEWLMTPVYLATKSERGLFLINFLPYLLMPGLVFSVFTRLGVNARVAWHWMWLLPTGYNFLLQAGSLGNDAFGAVYGLAAVDFALRAATSRRIADGWFSLLAAALLTGAKTGNLPLLLPWFIVFMPAAPRLFSRPAAGLVVILAAALVSFLPTALLNSFNCSDWTGLSLETPGIAMRNPLVGIAGNSAMFLLSNFVPTFFPLAGWWNHSALALLPGQVAALARANFEGNFYKLGEVPTEESAGLGFGLSCLLAATVLTVRFRRSQGQRSVPRPAWPRGIVLAAPYVSLFFFFAKSGMMTLARLVSAYYPLLLPALLVGSAPPVLVRHRWWRRATFVVLLLALATVVVTPARPLWPARTVLAKAGDASLDHPFVKRLKDVYLVYAERPDPLAQARAALPADCAVVGFVGGDNDPEISLWRPYGHRRVEGILPGDSPAQIRARQIQYAVVGEVCLHLQHQTIQRWLQQYDASLVTSFTTTLAVSDGPRFWYVVRLNPASANAGKIN
jgi:hypothetical protein